MRSIREYSFRLHSVEPHFVEHQSDCKVPLMFYSPLCFPPRALLPRLPVPFAELLSLANRDSVLRTRFRVEPRVWFENATLHTLDLVDSCWIACHLANGILSMGCRSTDGFTSLAMND